MFSFQGDFKRQRNINLGGRRRNDTARSNAQTVLDKAHEEREKRELERRERAAAAVIQQRWRGLRDTGKWRQQMRDRLDVASIEDPQSPARSLFAAVATFAQYYRGDTRDIGTLHLVLRSLFARAADGSRYRRMVTAADQPVEAHRWMQLAVWLLGSAVRVPKDGAVRVDVDLVLAAVDEAISADRAVNTDQWPLLRRLVVSQGLYAFLARCLSMGGTLGSTAAETAIRITAIPVGPGPLQTLAMPCFARWILAIPGLPNKIGVAGVTAITRAHIDWRLLAEHTRDEIVRQQASDAPSGFGVFGDRGFGDIALPLAAISILGNMTAFVLPQLSTQDPLTPLDAGFISACVACAHAIPSCDLFEAASKKAAAEASIVAARLLRAVDTGALKWLNSVLSVRVLGLLVRASCMDTAARENTCAREAQDLLLVFIQKWGKTASSTVIDNIFQAVDVRTVGWRAILHDRQFLDSFAGDRVRVDTIKSCNLAPLYLLCEVLNRQLETIGDDELFQQGKSLPLDDIRTVARVCRNIAFALYWSQEPASELVHIRDSAAALARQLFIRNARHAFVDDDFWLVPPALLDMASFADKVAEDPMFSAEQPDVGGDSDSDDGSSSAEESDADAVSPGMARAGIRPPDSRFDWVVSRYSSIARQRQRRTDELIMTPRIAVLRSIPFVVPFNDRVRLFHALVNRDRARLGLAAIGRASDSFAFSQTFAQAVVRRGHIFDDGFRQLYPVLSGKPAEMPPDSTDTDNYGGGQSRYAHAAPNGSREPMLIDSPDEMDDDNDNDGGSGAFGQLLRRFAARPADAQQRDHGGNPMAPMLSDLIDDSELIDSDGFAFRNSMSEIGGGPVSRQDMFKYRMKITFVDQYGMAEAGIDGGGVFKEFLTSLVREAFDPHTGLFAATAQHNIYPSPDAMQAADRQLVLDKFKFLGAVIGKALYEGVLVDAPFALFFLGYCVGQLPGFNDLPTLDADLYNGLVALKNYPVGGQPAADEEDEIYRVFGLDFTTTVSLPDGRTKTVPLVPRGDLIRVTAQNRLQYLDLVAQFKLVKQIDAQVRAFVSGLHTVVPENWMRLLFASPIELSRLLCGDSGAIDVGDWQRNTVYDGAFRGQGRSHPMVKEFWSVVERDLSEQQRQGLCRFATSCERPPLLGFAELNPRFCISGYTANEGVLDSRLPSASTCVNLLKLPVYSSRQILRGKLIAAIESNAGFDLS
ncbi:ubiquitin-protein ligase (E3) [Coemansia sp. RSA 2610]|nr:ubiquitin-protein ligase (E3) [Coemansia sp. RSA 2610]